MFLRNHDELTLEMVTDEERDYMFRFYAYDEQARINLGIRRRLAPLLDNDRRRIELMNALLFSLPGTPVLYYGDEIGMGDNVYLGDRNGVRTPMQWSSDRNAGFSRANPQRLYAPVIIDPEYHYESVNVEAQQANRYSLLNWTKRLIALRKRYRVFGHGSIEFLMPSNRKVLAFVRPGVTERVLVVANLSRVAQYAELDLSAHVGSVPVELFGRSAFPAIGEHPFLSPSGRTPSTGWRSRQLRPLRRAPQPRGAVRPSSVSRVTGARSSRRRSARNSRSPCADSCESVPWAASGARSSDAVSVIDSVTVPFEDSSAAIVLVDSVQDAGSRETHLLTLAFRAPEGSAPSDLETSPVIAHLEVRRRGNAIRGVLQDATGSAAFCRMLVEGMGRRRRWRGNVGEIAAMPVGTWQGPDGDEPLDFATVGNGQGGTVARCGGRFR